VVASRFPRRWLPDESPKGETMAVDHDDSDPVLAAYERGKAHQKVTDDAGIDREERRWRAGYLVALLAIAAASCWIAVSIRGLADPGKRSAIDERHEALKEAPDGR